MITELDEIEEIAEVVIPEAFHVHDERSADWVLRKIQEERTAAANARKWADEIIERAAKNELHLLNRFGAELENFARQQLENGKRKSLSLPSGSVGFRANGPKIEVCDNDAYVIWVQSNLPDACELRATIVAQDMSEMAKAAFINFLKEHDLPQTKFEVSVRKTVVNEYFKTTGEVPDGCDFVPASEVFYIK